MVNTYYDAWSEMSGMCGQGAQYQLGDFRRQLAGLLREVFFYINKIRAAITYKNRGFLVFQSGILASMYGRVNKFAALVPCDGLFMTTLVVAKLEADGLHVLIMPDDQVHGG